MRWKSLFQEYMDDEVPRRAAALSFYTILSLAPLVLIAVGLAGVFLDQQTVSQGIVTQFGGLIGEQGGELVQEILQHDDEKKGAWAAVIGIATLLFGASGVFGELQQTLNKMWEVKQDSGWKAFFMKRLLSFAMVLAFGFLLLVSLLLSTGLAALGRQLEAILPVSQGIMLALNGVMAFGIITLLVALLFKYIPDIQVPWRAAWIGAVVTALLFIIGKFVIGLYLGKASVGSAYGAAGSLLIILVWVYYSAQIFFFGAELTQVLSKS